jgi:hypothetical protein
MRRAFAIAGFAALLSAASTATAIAHENWDASGRAWRLQTTAFAHVASRGPPLDEPRWLDAAHRSPSPSLPSTANALTIIPTRAFGSSWFSQRPDFSERLQNPIDLWHSSLNTPGVGFPDTAAHDRGSQLVEHTILSEAEMRDLCVGVFLPIFVSALVILVELILLADRDILIAPANQGSERSLEVHVTCVAPVPRPAPVTRSPKRPRPETLDHESAEHHKCDFIGGHRYRRDAAACTRPLRSRPPWHRGSRSTPAAPPRHHHLARCAIRAPAEREHESRRGPIPSLSSQNPASSRSSPDTASPPPPRLLASRRL